MKVWVDCTAAAHPLVLRPIIERLEARGDEVFITAREYGQTVGILDRLGMHYTVVGEHGGASRIGKARALESRSRALTKVVWGHQPELALAHGSVDLAVVSWLLRISSVQMQDYEFANLQRQIAFRAARRVLMPESIPVDRLRKIGAKKSKLVRFPGLKEDYYLADFVPDEGIIEDLGLDRSKVIVVLRPPPETSEYHAPNDVYGLTIKHLAEADGEVQAVIIPRTPEQGEAARAFDAPNLLIPDRAIDAQSLIACADLVVSAGGTMNREAVALGTPVYTTFSGKMGGVDEVLIHDGRLQVLEDPSTLPLVKRTDPIGVRNPRDPDFLVEAVLGAVASTT
jgi:predicted glycosyltransferase